MRYCIKQAAYVFVVIAGSSGGAQVAAAPGDAGVGAAGGSVANTRNSDLSQPAPAQTEAQSRGTEAGSCGSICTLVLVIWGQEEKEQAERVDAMSRGGDSKGLSMPLLASSTRQSTVAGTRPFHIAWVGGKPPFTAELIGSSGAAPVRWPATTEREVLATVALEQGFYEVRVTDTSGHSVRGAFEVTAQAPNVDRRNIEQLSPDLGNALLAARLADMDGGAWRLEAYERLSELPDGAAARITAHRLANGLSVSTLRTEGAPKR